MTETMQIYDDLKDIINDSCVSYKRFKTTHIYISQLVKHCQHPYAMIVKDDALIGLIDIDNKLLIRFTSNKNFVDIAKIGKLVVTKIIRG